MSSEIEVVGTYSDTEEHESHGGKCINTLDTHLVERGKGTLLELYYLIYS